MKSHITKILFPILLVAVCLGGTSCKGESSEPESAQYSQMVGLWRAYKKVNGQKSSLTLWFRIKDDYTAETYWYNTQNSRYQYDQCTCKLTDNQLTIANRYERIYVYANSILRCLAEFKDPQMEWTDWNIRIDVAYSNEIKASIKGETIWLVRQNNIPGTWPAECSEPEIQATQELLTAKWNLRSYYRLTGNTFEAWNLTTPETQGMILTENGGFSNLQFFVNDLHLKEEKAGRINETDGIAVYLSECAWTATTNTFTFTCPRYIRIQFDASGNELARETVQPQAPIVINYAIYTMTDHWLTLYSAENNYYFSFHRSTASSSAPAFQRNIKRIYNSNTSIQQKSISYSHW